MSFKITTLSVLLVASLATVMADIQPLAPQAKVMERVRRQTSELGPESRSQYRPLGPQSRSKLKPEVYEVPPVLSERDFDTYEHKGYGKPGKVGPVYTFVKTDYHGNAKWGVRHVVGKKYAGHH